MACALAALCLCSLHYRVNVRCCCSYSCCQDCKLVLDAYCHVLGLCNAQVYSHMMAPLSWRSAGQQQQEWHRIDELLSVLKHPAVTLAQANSAQLELALLFSNNTNSTNTPTPVHVQGLVSLLSHTTPASAAAAASTLIILPEASPPLLFTSCSRRQHCRQ